MNFKRYQPLKFVQTIQKSAQLFDLSRKDKSQSQIAGNYTEMENFVFVANAILLLLLQNQLDGVIIKFIS